jgi:hypothetical protein
VVRRARACFDLAPEPALCDNFCVLNHHFDIQREGLVAENRGYHVHVYYNAETKPVAARLRETIIDKFAVEPGGFSDEPRGPHPIS